jgi:pimeloyl-ACP methyl ester carboxylesterase
MPNQRQFYIDGFTFAAQEWGQADGIPVLALHGWLDNSASFNAVAAKLKGVHLLALDLAGHGQSDHRAGSSRYNIWQDIPDVFAIADAMGWQQFALLGHSRGAMISLLAAGTFPKRISRIGLVEGLWPEPVSISDAPRQLAKSIRQYQSRKSSKLSHYASIDAAIAARQGGRFPLGYEAAKSIVTRGVCSVAGGYIWSSDPCLLMASSFKLSAEHIQAFVACIEVPIKLILAQQGIKGILDKYEAQINAIVNLDVEIFPGGHHLHMEEQSSLVSASLEAFFYAQ